MNFLNGTIVGITGYYMGRINELMRKVNVYEIRAIREIGVIRDSDKRGCAKVYQHFTKLNHTS